MMDLDNVVDAMTPEIYQRLVTAVELGKWPDGMALSAQQKEHSLQLVMLWQMRHNHSPQHMTIGTDGALVIKSKRQLNEELGLEPTTIITAKA